MRKLIVARRCSQAFFLMLFIHILWATAYSFRHWLPPDALFKINPLITILISISARIVMPGLSFALFMIVLTVIFGRFFCGWICPLGTVIDGVGALRKVKPSPSDSANKKIRKIKFFILGILAVFSLLGTQLAWVLDPLVIMARFVSLNVIPLGAKTYYFADAATILAVFLIVVFPALVISRVWCRMICPLGALYALISKAAILKRVVNKTTHCGVCRERCRMGAIKDDTSYIKSECILCMDCVYDCPEYVTSFAWHGWKSLK